MREDLFEHEATLCRERAQEFAGRAEQPFLLNLAAAFEELAHSSEQISEADRIEAAFIRPEDHVRRARRERTLSLVITVLTITLWAMLIAGAYLAS